MERDEVATPVSDVMMGKRIGIFGGTFNPVHCGHLINAQHIVDEFALDRVVFMPARHPVHKELEGGAGTGDRLRMLEIAVEGNLSFEVSRLEIERETPSYTFETLETMGRLRTGDELYLVIGGDSYRQLATWKEYLRILAGTPVIVLRRPGDEILPGIHGIGRFLFSGNPLVEISSKRIRSLVKNGKSVKYMVPDGVLNYINVKELYRT